MTTMAIRRVWTIVVGLAVLGAAFVGTPAGAKPGKPGAGAGNCVIELVRGSSKAASTTCFGAFTEAISFATQGRITDAPAAGLDAGFDGLVRESNQTAAVSPNASYVLSIEYFDTAGLGPALVFIGATQCTPSISDVDYAYTLAPVDYDQISSFYTSYCWVNHFYLANSGSANTGFWPCGLHHCPIRPMNDYPGDNNTRLLQWT